jgi:hypothetical protein
MKSVKWQNAIELKIVLNHRARFLGRLQLRSSWVLGVFSPRSASGPAHPAMRANEPLHVARAVVPVVPSLPTWLDWRVPKTRRRAADRAAGDVDDRVPRMFGPGIKHDIPANIRLAAPAPSFLVSSIEPGRDRGGSPIAINGKSATSSDVGALPRPRVRAAWRPPLGPRRQ